MWAPARIALGGVGVVVAVGGVIALRDATLSTHTADQPGSAVDVVLSARSEGAERGQSVPEMVEALLLVCRLEVTADLTGGIRAEGEGRYRVTLEPALDDADRRQLRGCVEDWTIDELRVDVVSFEERTVGVERSARP